MENHKSLGLNDSSTTVTTVINDVKNAETKEVVEKVSSANPVPAKQTSYGRHNFNDPICLQQNLFSVIPANKVVEYQWPSEASGEYFMLQEQVTAFLNIKSFKRKYPEIRRRKLEPLEINFLLSSQYITEVQVTLGLTALRSQDVCDMMAKEYPEKYKEYLEVMQEREKERRRSKYKHITTSSTSTSNTAVEKAHVPQLMKRAMKQAASFNSHLNRQRREEFAYYYDMHTQVLQYPANKVRKLHPSYTKPSLYPCALIPGQFQEYCKKYSKDELMYLPVQTALYGPPPPCPKANHLFSDSDSETESVISVTTTSSSTTSSLQNKNSQSLQTFEVKPDSSSSSIDSAYVSKATENGIKLESSNHTNHHSGTTASEKTSQEKESEKPVCGICQNDETCNKNGKREEMIKCTQCDNHGHPSCLDMTDDLVKVLKTYNWQCMECKTCTICSQPHREDLLMFCDRCDRGYHTYCVSLRAIPSGVWVCSRCVHEDPDFKKRRRKEMRLLSNSSPKPTTNQRKTNRAKAPIPSNNHHPSPLLLKRSNSLDSDNVDIDNHSSPKAALNSNNHADSGHEKNSTAVNNIPVAKRKILNNKQLNHIDEDIHQNGTLPNSQSHHKGNSNDGLINNHHGRSSLSNNKLKKISRKSIHDNMSMLKKEQIKTS